MYRWTLLCLLTGIGLATLGAPMLLDGQTTASVVTAHNDVARTGQNLNETILTPADVNPAQFGRLFSWIVDGGVYPQPLYLPQVTVPGKGVHNIVFVGTTGDSIYALDGDSNGGVDATPLWRAALLTNTTPSGTYVSQFGICGTPVIDQTTGTLYAISSEMQGRSSLFRLHALDVTTGAEKLGGPLTVQGSVLGTGSGSSAGRLAFDAAYEKQRPALLLQNGVLYAAFGSINDVGPWHGWIFSYNAATLQAIDVFSPSANGSGAGVWMGGSGLAAEVNDPGKPFGRMFFASGNGGYSASPPYSNAMSYGMSVVDLDLSGGVMTVADAFTPAKWSLLNAQDGDLGSGGPVLLPAQTLASGALLHPLVEVGKSGTIYLLDRENLGGFNAGGDRVEQEVQTPVSGVQQWGAGIWGSSAYWKNTIYFGGTNPGGNNSLTAYSLVKGVLSSLPTSQTSELFSYPGPTPSISANGAEAGILWVVDDSAFHLGPAVLLAYDAGNLEDLLYSSDANLARDDPGPAIEFTVPTVANGKVYVGAGYEFSVFGLLNAPIAATPLISPAGGSFAGAQRVTISDATVGAQILYTTDGSTPSASSAVYKGPITVASSETISAIGSATGYLLSAPASASFSSSSNAANPLFSLAGGSYTGAQSLTLADSSPGAIIYYTVDGTMPSTSSRVATGEIAVTVSEVVQAMATAPGLLPSAVTEARYTLQPAYTINFSGGFAQAQGPMSFNGSTDLDDFRLQLTNGGQNEAGSAFYSTPVNVRSFTTDFVFQLSDPTGDGFTFTIQNAGATALGGRGGSLGYAGIPKSVAIKFDLYDNAGEGPNSTGLYVDGAQPTVPAMNLVGTGIDLHDGDYTDVHMTYDGTKLTLTISNPLSLASWSASFAIDIPATVGSNTAYVGFTGGTGGASSSQKLTSWTYLAGPPPLPNYPVGFDSAGLAINGNAGFSGSSLQLTNGRDKEDSSVYFMTPVNIEAFSADFDFQISNGTTPDVGDGFTFVLQNDGVTELGGDGGGLGYASMPNSVAVKFDLFNNAGEGSDSTGLYLSGAVPTVPAIDLTPSGVRLGGGDVIHAHVAYDGTTLVWILLDEDSPLDRLTATESVVINIPHTVGSNTAYVGFTAASGGASAVQSILDFTFTNP